MDDDLLQRIKALTDEERELEHAQGSEVPQAKLDRLDAVRTALDQCWDLLRQRRARREFGEDPEDAKVRSADVVEHYEQ